MARACRRRPGSASASRGSRSPASARAWRVTKDAAGEQARANIIAERAAFAEAVHSVAPAATDWPVFQAFLHQGVIAALQRPKPGATLVLDHLAAHRLRQARPPLESAGFALLPLPRYSPDLSPIEHGWSKLKTPLRTAEPRSIAASEAPIGPARDTITPADATGWFRHCGYSVSN